MGFASARNIRQLAELGYMDFFRIGMKYEDIISAFGVNYLKGEISKVWVGEKFCLLDNLEDKGESNKPDVIDVPRLRFPVKVTLTFCIFCKRGRISSRIQQRDYVAEAGSLLIIFSGQILENVELSEDCIVIFVAVDSEYIMTEIRGPHGRSLRQWVLHNQEPTLVSIDEDEALNFEKLCQSLKFIVKNSDSETSDGILSGFTYIFASLLLKWRKRSTDDCAHDDSLPDGGLVYTREREVLFRFQSDIHNFSRKDRSVGFYARRQCISEKHFSRLVKKASGYKPLDLIRDYVILDAKSLLLSGKYSIKQVSEMLGFQNHSFFTRFFRTSVGKTPGEFMLDE